MTVTVFLENYKPEDGLLDIPGSIKYLKEGFPAWCLVSGYSNKESEEWKEIFEIEYLKGQERKQTIKKEKAVETPKETAKKPVNKEV